MKPDHLDPLLLRDREHDRRSRVAQLLNDADQNAFDCAATEKSDKTIQRMQQIRKDESRKLDFNKKHFTSLPSRHGQPPKGPTIKMTTAALLREEKLYAKREEHSLQQLEKLLQGARDDSDFKQWRDKIKQEELDEQLTRQFENILSGQLSRYVTVFSNFLDFQIPRDRDEEILQDRKSSPVRDSVGQVE